MAILKVKDMNDKEFSYDSDKICSINGDLSDATNSNIADSAQRKRLLVAHDTQYTDQNGTVLDSTQILQDMASGKTNVVAIDVEAESTHSGKNHNYCIYYEDSMETDAESFTNPFKKPMLKNHNEYSGEPIGRIRQAWHGPSNLTDERSAIHTVTRVTDKDAIEKFLDGRYSTLSIGGSMGTVTCNICGKTILKDGKFKFCGHWKGETYKDQVCYWGVRDIEYNEHSVVNNPADDFAQVMKITVITDKDKNKDSKEGDNTMDGDNNTQDSVKTNNTETKVTDKKEQLMNLIDSILGDEQKVKTPEVADATTPNADEATGTESKAKDSQEEKTPEKTIEDYQKENKELSDSIESIKKELEDSKAQIEALTTEKDEALEDAKNMKEQCVQLAIANKSIVADSIIELENVEDAKKEDRKKEILGMSMKDIQDMKDKLLQSKSETSAQRTQAKTQNPTLANANEAGAVVVDSEGQEVTNEKTKVEDSNKKSNINDVTDSIVKKLTNRH